MVFLISKAVFTSDVALLMKTVLLSTLRRRFDLQNPSRMDRNVEMFLNVEKNLVQVPSDEHVKPV